MPVDDVQDATVIGGSFAGISAALYMARAHCRVLVLDAGEPRNRFAAASHGFFGHDGEAPGAMIEEARRQLLLYPSVRLVKARVREVVRCDERFLARTEDGSEFLSRKLVLATGVEDVLPDIPGVRERWGASVLHCPYCHGYEVSGRRLGVLALSAMSVHQAQLVSDWGPVTFFVDGTTLDDEARAALARRSVTIVTECVARLEGADARLDGIRLRNGHLVPVDALFLAPPVRMTCAIAERLGCAFDESPLGPVVRTDSSKLTTVPGVYAAGDAARWPHSVGWAVADGITAGVALHQALLAESGPTGSP